MLNHSIAKKEAAFQAPFGYQMHQWLSESSKEAPWTPFRLTTSAAGQVAAHSAIDEDLKEISDTCVAQASAHGNTKS